MKRRKFIQAALITGAAPVAALGNDRLYGTPGSVLPSGGTQIEKFMVPLAHAGLPQGGWNDFAGIASAIEGVLTIPAEAKSFGINPKAFLVSKGLDASDQTLMDDSVIMLACLTNSTVQESINRGEYAATLSYFEAAGLFERRSASQLEQRLEGAISQNITEIRGLMGAAAGSLSKNQENLLVEVLEASGARVTEDDFAIVAQIMRSSAVSPQAVVPVLVVVVIVALAAAYISVAVGVTVALAVGAVVSAAVKLAVAASGTNPNAAGPGEMAPFSGSMARLDPTLMKNTERAIKMSRILGSKGLETHVMKELIREEVSAFMKALSSTKLMPMNEEQLQLAIRATTAYSYRVIGI